jgi:glycosyltransferase involved in cell wall biosynthesis
LGLVDIYIHPGRLEGFGLAMVEAMLAARPVVASRDGAFVEYIRSGENGLLFKPGDANDLADAIMLLASDWQKAAEIGAAARESCLEKFNINHFADAVCAFIEEAHPAAVRRRRGAVAEAAAGRDVEVETAGAQG